MTFTRNAILLAVIMLGTSMLSVALTPTRHAATAQFDLESLIPRQFGDWQVDQQTAQATVLNPQSRELLDKIYSQVLSRTYINSDGRRIMLSIAYGVDQSQDTKIHRPEICYPAQGFQLVKKWNESIHAGTITLPVMRIESQLGNRHEPVTYWIRLGNSLVRGSIEQSIARIDYGLKNRQIPDGVLFRVSEINSDTKESLVLQDQFIRTLLTTLPPSSRKFLIASSSSEPN
jgi:EpsI family protein